MGSIKLLTIRGIPIRMHITFPLILVLAAFQFGLAGADWVRGAVFGVIVTLLLFVGVVLHELAHSLVAMGFGTKVREIVLLPLGGVARMENLPERPSQELLMAVAGPVASAVIGATLGAITRLTLPDEIWWEFLPAIAEGRPQWTHLLPYLAFVNIFLAAFNLIPAFPMDGGRVLRALLAAMMPYGRATAIAVSIGQGLAWLMGLVGLLRRDVLVMLVALFVYIGATQEGRMTQVKLALAGLKVGRAFSRRALPVGPNDSLAHAVDLTLEGFQSDFPVCDGEKLVGMLTRADILLGLKEHGPTAAIHRVMRQSYPVASPDDDLFEVQQRMSQAGLEAIPVVEGAAFQGLLTRQDLEEVYTLVSARPGLLRGEERERLKNREAENAKN
ncbi:MAG: site-2 protease family protein [Anaerolineae bacterium]|nr:site-2 protease family protein [Anaerolineae bacterium]